MQKNHKYLTMNRKSIFENGDTCLNLKGIFKQRRKMNGRMAFEEPAFLPDRLLDYLDCCLDRFVLKERLFLSPKMSLPFLAGKLHTNRTYVSSAIHSLYGVRFNEFISVLRIEYSKKLLKIVNLDLENVASACGYLYASQFTKKFKEVEGVNPSLWRQFVMEDIEK